MVIKKLNSLFHKHSRVLFGAFTVLIILAFTDFLTPGSIGGCNAPEKTPVGTAFGEKVTAGDLQKIYRDLSIYLQIAYGGDVNVDQKGIFDQYCLLKRAEQLGVKVSNEEVAEKIQSSPVFGGKFTAEAYDKFLKERNLNGDDVVEAVRLGMTGEKLLKNLGDGVVVTEAEAKELFANYEQKLTMKFCSVKFDTFTVPEADSKALDEFYKKNSAKYMTDGIVKLISAEIPYKKFEAAAAEKVTAEMVENAKKRLPGMDDAQIKVMLARQLTDSEAKKEAMSLYSELLGKLKADTAAAEQIKIFEAWAADKALVVSKEDVKFSEENIALQQFPLNGIRLFRGLRPAENGVSLVMVVDRVEPKAKAISEILTQLKADAKLAAQQQKAVELMEGEIKKLNALKAEERAKAFAALKGTFREETLPQGSYADLVRVYSQIAPQMMSVINQDFVSKITLNIGEVSSVQGMADGSGVEIFLVTGRVPADEKNFAARKDFYLNMAKELKTVSVMRNFLEDMQRQCQFTMAAEKPAPEAAEQAK